MFISHKKGMRLKIKNYNLYLCALKQIHSKACQYTAKTQGE